MIMNFEIIVLIYLINIIIYEFTKFINNIFLYILYHHNGTPNRIVHFICYNEYVKSINNYIYKQLSIDKY